MIDQLHQGIERVRRHALGPPVTRPDRWWSGPDRVCVGAWWLPVFVIEPRKALGTAEVFAWDQPEEGTDAGPVKRCQSPTSTANPNAVRIPTPRRRPSRPASGAHGEVAESSAMPDPGGRGAPRQPAPLHRPPRRRPTDRRGRTAAAGAPPRANSRTSRSASSRSVLTRSPGGAPAWTAPSPHSAPRLPPTPSGAFRTCGPTAQRRQPAPMYEEAPASIRSRGAAPRASC
jgi:hypothetical protein